MIDCYRLEEEEDLEREMSELEVEIEKELEERKKRVKAGGSPYSKTASSPASPASSQEGDTPTGSPAPVASGKGSPPPHYIFYQRSAM